MVDYVAWPDHIVYPEDNPILTKWVKWSISNNTCCQPEGTVAAVLTGTSAIMGQMYLISNEFCNLYSAILLNTGRGKDGILRGMTGMMAAAGYESLVGASSFSSGPGMLTELVARNGRVLWPIDELAPDLRAIVSSNSASHKEEILSYLLSMSSRKKFVKQLAKSHFEIQDPCPVVFAGCQPQLFWDTVSNDKMLTSGFGNRFFIVNGNNYARPSEYLEYNEPDQDVVNYLKGFDTSDYGPGTVNDIEGNRKKIGFTEEAKEIWSTNNTAVFDIIDKHQIEGNNRTGQLMIRDSFKAMRLAAVYSWLKNYNDPVIDSSAAKWAWFIINNSSAALRNAVEEHTHATPVEKDYKTLVRNVYRHGDKGIEMNKLKSQCTAFVSNFDRLFQSAMDVGHITNKIDERKNKPTRIMVYPTNKKFSDDD